LDAQRNADNVKAACYFLGIDAVGISRCPDWAYYSHDAAGIEIHPTQDQAISMIVDQRFDSMDGSSGDDWISVALSMRAYLRFSLLGGVIAEHIRSLGYEAKAHTATDSDVIHPPLLLLSGLGEVSRIGEVILNPYLGPRLKSGIVTTNMPMAHDKPIDFGMQKFCESCNKCARECPSGAITAGPKKMFNGYEIWKSDSQRCATYRITSPSGAMCGRCMKTCPWNLEGLFAEAPFRWAAMNIPAAAPMLAKLDDMVGNGERNTVKKWWWDLEIQADEGYRPTTNGVHERDLQKDLKIDYADQTLAVFPADQAPHPYPFPFPIDREQGIQAYENMISANEHRARVAAGDADDILHKYTIKSDAKVLQLDVVGIDETAQNVIEYQLAMPDGADLPEWTAGAHIDVVVAPGFIRQYSLAGNPADRSKYTMGVLREDEGKGGSKLMHRIFTLGRKIFISHPINHFPLDHSATKTFLMGGGIGITPMIAMAHELHADGADFELHYCCSSRETAGFLNTLANAPWVQNVHFHFSADGTRADLPAILGNYRAGHHVYTCGPDRFMEGVIDAATNAGFPDEARHLEYFTAPEAPEYENHAFTIHLTKSNKTFEIPADRTTTDILLENGIHVDMKCADGICGVCKCGLVSGDVEHRDFVLSNKQRETSIILCQSRAADANGVIEVDL
jgi:reductive dehalogenase